MHPFITKIVSSRDKWMVFVDQAMVSGVNFLMTLLLARFLGLENFGLFALGWMLVLFFSSIQIAFIIQPLYTLLPKHARQEKYENSIQSLQAIYSLAAGVISFLIVKIACIVKPEWLVSGVTWSLPLVVMLFGWQDFYRRFNLAKKQQLKTLKTDIIAYGLQPLILVFLWFFQILTIHHMYLGLSILFVGSVCLSWYGQKWTFKFKAYGMALRENWAFSKYLIGTALLQWVSGNFFIITAGTLLTPVAIGIVRIAQNVVGILNVLFAALENIVPLKAAHLLHQQGNVFVIKYFQVILIRGGLVTFFMLGSITLFREPIIKWFYGLQYLGYENVIIGFAIIYLFVFINTVLGFAIRTFEMNRIFLVSYILTSVFSILAARPFIEEYGVYGVVVGILVTQLINSSVYIISLKQKEITLWK